MLCTSVQLYPRQYTSLQAIRIDFEQSQTDKDRPWTDQTRRLHLIIKPGSHRTESTREVYDTLGRITRVAGIEETTTVDV